MPTLPFPIVAGALAALLAACAAPNAPEVLRPAPIPEGRILMAAGADLHALDPEVPARSFVHRRSPPTVFFDLARDPTTGARFAITNSELHRLDLQSGEDAFIGSMNVYDMNALAFDGQGALFGASAGGIFYRVDPATGRTTALNPSGLAEGVGGDLAFAPDGTLYATLTARTSDRLVTVDSTTGLATNVGLTGVKDVYGLAFRGERLYGVTRDGEVVRLDRTTGAATSVGSIGLSEVEGLE